METHTKPTILFVHGSWHHPAHFAPVRKLFEAAHYPTECPVQPTYNPEPSPPGPPVSLSDDARVIQSQLTKLVEEEGKDVIVVMHSWGGMVGSEATKKSYSKKDRSQQGKPGGVLKLVYLCALIVPLGKSLMMARGDNDEIPPWLIVQEGGLITMADPARRFYNDLSPVEQDRWLAELRPTSVLTQSAPLTHAAYQHYDSAYLFCKADEAIPLEFQKIMVEMTGVNFYTEECTAGHSPFLSQPQTVLDFVKKFEQLS
ncbi:FAD binding domain-containing protein [Rutstroemia sp. NJR-2017a BBW]|nr:FAD binding domain-containing protein [Rutstroemia sp. NJR-2017a BBW]